ncbi:thiolase domain-containing protein [Sphingomonas histidinilytica]|uniref:Acetyl-CoA C-acetyltransferase n=2 Tax=Rhizorhabdus histidinilytica TaxID=439228 RepID=A0A1T5GUU8_9SPHN|nr:thiolase domain-containing protein [Rhizorhabdus histidinilytica]MBO9380671.1 thiolase domain-containing protein [Rhizorhabdus histidinilytica]SKC12193.1 acetyl-CoA C-acetyltransferase [Rhizorhabdus histidinilytica]
MDAHIVGWGHTRFGKLGDLDLEALIREAAVDAMVNAGVTGDDIDGVWLGNFNSGLVPDGFCSSMILHADPGLRFKPAIRCENACASGSAAIYSALDAINSGRCRIALVVGAEKMTALDTAGVTSALGGASYQAEEQGMSFPQIFARFAQAYDAAYGDPAEALAHIAVKNHDNAMRNPLAHMHKPVDFDFCMTVSERNPMIAAPLKLSDCSLISDGAAALVIAHRSVLDRFSRAVGFRAAEMVSDYLPLSAKRLEHFEGPSRAIQQAYKTAGITVDDLDLAEVHDCFTIAELLSVEALGLAEPGQGTAVVREGQTTRQGRLPINLSGGLKAKGHPVGATGVSMHVMVARQLLGETGDMQLDEAPELGLCLNLGGGAVNSAVSILEPVKA